jgi:peptidoglycan/LPS O-acetylase OafA/YrhL
VAVLADRFDPRSNGFDALRVFLAALVAVDHGIIMRTGVLHELHGSALGDFAVDGFFVLSGFLVCRSYQRLGSVARYTWHRALRILPAFWVCLLLTAFVAAPVIAVLENKPMVAAFTKPPTALQYLTDNAFLMMRQFSIADLLSGNPAPATLNGSLWTLFYEAQCYALIAGLGLLGVLTRRRWLVLALTLALWGVNLGNALGAIQFAENTARLTFIFLLGGLAHLYADRVPTGLGWLVASSGVFIASLIFAEPYRLLGAAAFAYLLIWLGTCAPLSLRVRADLSYGLYIYHFLIFQMLMVTPLRLLPVPLFILVGGLLALLTAAGSWFLVERPALSRKGAPFVDHIDRSIRSLQDAITGRLAATARIGRSATRPRDVPGP